MYCIVCTSGVVVVGRLKTAAHGLLFRPYFRNGNEKTEYVNLWPLNKTKKKQKKLKISLKKKEPPISFFFQNLINKLHA